MSSRTGLGLDLFALLMLHRVQAGEIQATSRGYAGPAGRPVNRDLARDLERLRRAGYLSRKAADIGGRGPVMPAVAGAMVLSE